VYFLKISLFNLFPSFENIAESYMLKQYENNKGMMKIMIFLCVDILFTSKERFPVDV
jgi:uncharacterized membrane protein